MDETGKISDLARMYALAQNPQTIMPIPPGPLEDEARHLLQGETEAQVDPQGNSPLAEAYRQYAAQYAATRTGAPQTIVDSLRHKRTKKAKARTKTRRARVHNTKMRSRGK